MVMFGGLSQNFLELVQNLVDLMQLHYGCTHSTVR